MSRRAILEVRVGTDGRRIINVDHTPVANDESHAVIGGTSDEEELIAELLLRVIERPPYPARSA